MWFTRGVSGPGSNGSKPDVFVACLFQHSCRGLAGLRSSQASRAATVEQGKCARPLLDDKCSLPRTVKVENPSVA